MATLRTLGKQAPTSLILAHTNLLKRIKIAEPGQDEAAPPVAAPPSVQEPRELRPQLFLVEHYRLSTFRGDLLRDELLATVPPVLPQTELKYKVITKKKTSEQTSKSSTVLDSRTESSARTFNQSLASSADAKFGNSKYDYGMNGNFHGEGRVGFGKGSVDAHVDVAGSTNEVRSEMSSSVSSAIDAQVNQANEARRDQVTVGTDATQIDSETETESVQVTKNTSDRTWNFGVFQLKEELVAVLSLVDVEVAFRNTDPGADRKVPLFKVDALLEETIATPAQRALIKKQIQEALEGVRDFRDEKRSILSEERAIAGELVVNKRLESKLELKRPDGSVRRTVSVPGVILKTYRRYPKKQGATVLLQITQ